MNVHHSFEDMEEKQEASVEDRQGLRVPRKRQRKCRAGRSRLSTNLIAAGLLQ
jgi:hypothetical protein